jgi:hypothetical protein
VRALKVPSWESGQHTITIQWNDFESVDSAKKAPPPVGTNTPCRPRLTFKIPQPRQGRVVKAYAYVDGKLVKRVRGHSVKRVTIKAPNKVNFNVRIVSFTNTGKRIVSVRKYRRCHKTRPHRV